MAMLRTLIVDDVALARQKLARLLAAHADVAIVGEAQDGPAAVAAILALAPDLVFLDIQMPELDGFSVLAESAARDPAGGPAIVFVTAYDHYAVRAFGVEALDYLLKPPAPERLAQCLQRVRAWHAQKANQVADAPQPPARPHLARIDVREGDRRRWVAVDHIAWIAAAGNYLVLHADNGRHVIRMPLADLERQLDPARFCRIGRSRLVALDRVRALCPRRSGDQTAVLADGTRLPVSRSYRAELIARLQGRTG
jgi:two-component system LytT family response regulator